MQTLKLKEPLKIEEKTNYKDSFRSVDCTDSEFELIKEKMSSIFKFRKNHKICLRKKFHIGVIQVNDLVIQIIPRFINAKIETMLKYALFDKCYSGDLRNRIAFFDSLARVSKRDNTYDFLTLFIQFFLKNIYDLMTKKNYREYMRINAERKFPKGKILVSKTVQNYKGFYESVVCDVHLFSKDTDHNQIIKFVLEKVKYQVPSELKPLYNQIIRMLDGVKYVKWTVSEIKNLVYDRLNIDYKPVHDICCFVLENFIINFGSGSDFFYSYLLISTPNIFEAFLRGLFSWFLLEKNTDQEERNSHKRRQKTNLLNYEVPKSPTRGVVNIKFLDNSRKLKKNQHYDVMEGKISPKRDFKITPDIRFKENGKTKFFLDAKYKEIIDIAIIDDITNRPIDIQELIKHDYGELKPPFFSVNPELSDIHQLYTYMGILKNVSRSGIISPIPNVIPIYLEHIFKKEHPDENEKVIETLSRHRRKIGFNQVMQFPTFNGKDPCYIYIFFIDLSQIDDEKYLEQFCKDTLNTMISDSV